MSDNVTKQEKDLDVEASTEKPIRSFPRIYEKEDEGIQVDLQGKEELRQLYGVKTDEVANTLLESAISSLGHKGDTYRQMIVAMAAEMEPQDAIEALLVNQMVATHAAMSVTSFRLMDSDTLQRFEVYEKALARLSRTFMRQVEALKKYRAKVQQVVRVERVTVEDGGQAIVGDVTTGGPS